MAPSQNVLADPQYGIFQILRPQENFRALYQGQAASPVNPIYFFKNGQHLDSRAGEPGYDPRLVSGLSVPMGATVNVWVPNLVYLEAEDPDVVLRSYIWFMAWRARNIVDFRTERKAWHVAVTRGVADTTPVTGGERTVIPAAYQTVVYNQPEPIAPTTPDSGRAVQHGRAEDMTMSALTLGLPIIAPGVRGVIQQGVQDPAAVGDLAIAPGFLLMSARIPGDEILVGAYRNPTPATWDFTAVTGADAAFGNFFSASENLGIYVPVGTP